ncbi:MAG: rRNA maturation RNase YbeY [Tannerella sp.]|jgi:rRNA maturation RNase YbeY|nr:rRNA maturation RNase YbeY [Tannerella sp.]
MAVNFFAEEVTMPPVDKMAVRRWIKSVAAGYGRTAGALTYIFCTDDKILDVNSAFLQHDYYTDIITFDYSEGTRISGDLFISLDTVRSNSQQFGATFTDELLRVMIHGVLHLCGLTDKCEVEQLRMREAENDALKIYAHNCK